MGLVITVNQSGEILEKKWMSEPIMDEEGNPTFDENGNVLMDTAPEGMLN